MTWMQVEQYLLEDDRCVLPLGSTEQHAHLSLAADAILAEKVAADAAESLGLPVFPAVPYGLTPYFIAYPGTVTLTTGTYAHLLKEVLSSIVHHGFRRILVVNGHGGNREGVPAAMAWASEHAGVTLRWHDWWAGPQTMDAVQAIDPAASHASWMEGFPWTRVAGAGGRDPLGPQGHRRSRGPRRFVADRPPRSSRRWVLRRLLSTPGRRPEEGLERRRRGDTQTAHGGLVDGDRLRKSHGSGHRCGSWLR